MKFLADAGVSLTTTEVLRRLNHDVVHLREQGLQKLPDVQVLEKARSELRVLLTFDLDFADLLALGVYDSPSVVIFRLRDAKPDPVNRRLLDVLDARAAELDVGVIIVVEESRYRMRRLPISGDSERVVEQ
jgi:predicted nuclease of predicted toxin-antitoxin system